VPQAPQDDAKIAGCGERGPPSAAFAPPAGVELVELRARHLAERLHRLTKGVLRLVRQVWQCFERQRAGHFQPDERFDFRLRFDAG
jgi:hypothetical protein